MKKEDEEATILNERSRNYKTDRENDPIRNNINEHFNQVATNKPQEFKSYEEISAHYLEQNNRTQDL